MTAPRVGYYDIECHAWSTFVVGATLAPGDAEPVAHWHDASGMLDAMAEVGGEWRAHYGGRYDVLLLLTLACERSWRVTATMRGASVLVARLRAPGDTKTRLTLVDTHALAPVSLAKLAAAAGGETKGRFDFSRIVPGLEPSSPDGRALWEYLRRDVLALRDGDTAWRAVLREVAGVEPGRTLGGVAWKSAALHLATLADEDVAVSLDRHDYADGRTGYFGGRVEVMRERASSLQRYDRNSSYPAALTRQAVPVGRRVWRRTWNGEPGTVWARVRVPMQRHPPLPVRFPSRVLYPTGTFDGVWTAPELQAAVDSGDAKLVRVYRARVASETTLALREWCLRVWSERVARPEWNGLLKLLANSLTGKLAQRDGRATLRYGPVTDAPAGEPTLTEPRDGMVWWSVTTHHIAPCARPEWAAYLTAEARVELRAQLEHAGAASLYCDTDSVYASRALSRNLGADLGEWKHEGAGYDWHARAPKLYAYTDEGDARRVKSKGLRGLTAEGFERLSVVDSKGYSAPWADDAGVESLRASLARGGEASFTRRALARRVRLDETWCGGRLRGAPGGDTRAPTYGEALDRWGKVSRDE